MLSQAMLDTSLKLFLEPMFDTPEGSRTMLLEFEPLVPAGRIAPYTSKMKWGPPDHAQLLDAAERARIIGNIRATFDFMGWTLVV